jgi:DNA-binding transcriptional LysR family regulator
VELRHLRYFVSVAECGGFVRASASLRVAQPALSRQIHDLEQELGVVLFERSRRGASLTISGECFLQDARHILACVEQAQGRVRRVEGGYAGILSIGLVESFAWHDVITQSLRKFQSRCPDIVLSVAPMSSPEQLVAIREGQLSTGFLFNRPAEDEALEGLEVLTTRAMLAVPEGSPYATRPPRRLAELQEERFVFIERARNPVHYDRIIHACHGAGLTPRIAQSGTNDSSNLSLVAAGLGLSIVPAAMESRKPRNVVLVPVDDLKVTTTMQLVWRKDNNQPALMKFIEVLRSETAIRTASGA